MRKALLAIIVVAVALPAVLAAGLMVATAAIDWKPAIERWASGRLGRQVSVGALALKWPLPLGIEARNVRLANAEWGSRANMLEIGTASAELALVPLLKGTLRFRRLDLVDMNLYLERAPDGHPNWIFRDDGRGGGLQSRIPTIESGNLRNGRLTYRGLARTALVELGRLTIDGASEGVRLEGNGRYDDTPVTLAGQGGSFDKLRDTARPYPMQFTIESPTTAWSFDGVAGQPLVFGEVRGQSRLEGSDLAAFGRIIRVPLPSTPPYVLSGQLSRTLGAWAMADGRGRVGNDEFTGQLTINLPGGGPSNTRLRIAFASLHPEWLLRLGAEPARNVIPGRATGSGWSVRGEVTAEKIEYETYPLGKGEAVIHLEPGLKAADEVRIEIAGGVLEGTMSAKSGTVTADLRLRKIGLAPLIRGFGATESPLDGPLAGSAQLSAETGSFDHILQTLGGEVSLFAGPGTIRRALVAQADLDLTSILAGSGPAEAQMQCLAGVMRLDQGVGNIRALVLRTAATTIAGKGQVDLRTRSIDISIQGETHGPSIFNLDAPVRLNGPWNHPQVTVDPTSIMARGGLAALLGVVAAPLAALVPMIGLGSDNVAQCAELESGQP